MKCLLQNLIVMFVSAQSGKSKSNNSKEIILTTQISMTGGSIYKNLNDWVDITLVLSIKTENHHQYFVC